jgi:hypothetical protein
MTDTVKRASGNVPWFVRAPKWVKELHAYKSGLRAETIRAKITLAERVSPEFSLLRPKLSFGLETLHSHNGTLH